MEKPYLIFVHIGKTSGMSMRRWINSSNVEDQYKWVAQIYKGIPLRDSFGPLWYASTKYTIVRHPVERYKSVCRHLKKDANDPLTLVNEGINVEFFRPMSQTLIEGGELQVDKVFKLEEDVPDNMVAWHESLGITNPEPYPHFTQHQPDTEKEELTEETLYRVRDYYNNDFANFGYTID